jgi:uncharacterized protein (DUF305 family)
MKNTRWLVAPALATAVALSLAACSGTTDDGAGATPDRQATTRGDGAATADATAHNEADTEFAQMMIIHHEGAIEMAQLAVEKASTEDVRALGERIAAAQGPEIATMSGWLEAWGEEPADDAEMSGMGHEGMDMEGMDQEAVMAELSGLNGTDFDRRFLELMIDHHRGAIEMAEAQREAGESPQAIQLAGQIIDDQTVEITEMGNLLGDL